MDIYDAPTGLRQPTTQAQQQQVSTSPRSYMIFAQGLLKWDGEVRSFLYRWLSGDMVQQQCDVLTITRGPVY